MATERGRGVFLFSFHEHDWMSAVESEEAANQALFQQAAGSWKPVTVKRPDEIATYCDENVETLEDLIEQARATMVDEWGLSADVVEAPFKTLRAMMARDGWRFVGGTFMEFEGHHNDTEIHVVLER